MRLVFEVQERTVAAGKVALFPFVLFSESLTTLSVRYDVTCNNQRFVLVWCQLRGPGRLRPEEQGRGEVEVHVPDDADLSGTYHLQVTARSDATGSMAVAACDLVVEDQGQACARFAAAPALTLNPDGTVTVKVTILNCGGFDLDVSLDLRLGDLLTFHSDDAEVTLGAKAGPVEVERTFHPSGDRGLSGGEELTVEINWEEVVLDSVLASVPSPPGGGVKALKWVVGGLALLLGLLLSAWGLLAATDNGETTDITTASDSTLPTNPSGGTGTFTFSVAPQSVQFDALRARQATVTVTNTGSERLQLRRPELTGEDRDQFSADAAACLRIRLEPGQRCDMRVVFAPTRAGVHGAQLVVSAEDGERPAAVVLGATERPVPAVQPRLLDFTRSSGPMRVSVRNAGSLPMVVEKPTITGPQSSDFSLVDVSCSSQPVAPGKECSIEVRFDNRPDRNYRALLQIPIEGAQRPVEVPLTATDNIVD